MNITNSMIYVLLTLVLNTGLAVAGTTQASDETSPDKGVFPAIMSGELYLPSDSPMVDLAASLDVARKSDRLLLVVLGANWCHDSRALASRLFEGPLSTTINEQYELLFVDVGYLEKGKDVITSLGIPVYYATPTVLIVDPVSHRVINAQNRHQWGHAASISMQESVEYFEQFANTALVVSQDDNAVDANLQELLNEIEAFEQAQADRLYQAYAVLTPMLRAYKESDNGTFSDETWNEVRDYRFKVPVDVEALRAEARARVVAGENNIKLIYPVYPAFSWDTP